MGQPPPGLPNRWPLSDGTARIASFIPPTPGAQAGLPTGSLTGATIRLRSVDDGEGSDDELAEQRWVVDPAKVEAGAPSETAPREQFVQVVASEIRRAGMRDQVTIQSFDWGALMRMAEVEPRIPLVALTNYTFLQIGQPGASPWLGGIDIDDFGGDPLPAIASFGADTFSPVHGFPQNGGVEDADYVPYVTAEMVDHAHELGIQVVPWTVDDEATMRALIDAGVDGIITNYPDRLRTVMTDHGFRLPRTHRLRHR